MITFHTALTNFVLCIIIIKILLISTGVITLMLGHYHTGKTTDVKTIKYIHDWADFLFNVSMPILLLIIFNPRNPRLDEIDTEVMFILFVYGILMLMKIDWSDAVKDSPLLSDIKKFIDTT